MNKTFLSLSATCLLLAGAPALAASSSSATISGFGYTLVDLNPLDGLDAFISFSSPSYGSFASSTANDAASGTQSGTAWSFVPFGGASSTSAAGGASASGSVSGAFAGGGLSYSASGSAAGAALPGYATSFQAAANVNDFFGGMNFTLSAYTLVVFTGTVNLSAATTVGYDPIVGFAESASAGTGLSVSGTGAGGTGAQSSSDGFSVYADWTSVYNPETGTFSYSGRSESIVGTLTGSFTNFSAGSLNGTLNINASASGYSNVAVVPEPGSYALMLAGLMAVGFVARRRRG